MKLPLAGGTPATIATIDPSLIGGTPLSIAQSECALASVSANVYWAAPQVQHHMSSGSFGVGLDTLLEGAARGRRRR